MLAHYRIVQKLGEGGMGVVYKAQDTHLDRPVAVKVLPPEKVDDPERKRRFVQEAKAASALNHPNIVTVYDIDTSDGVTFIAMEYVPGKALDEVLARKTLRLNEALGYAVHIADALSAAHAAGIVHRDLKPSNIMVGDDGRVRVLDFGLAKLTGTGEAAEFAATATAPPISEAGAVLGTFAYMSPEQAEGRPVDARSDVFSFGVVLYEMLARRHPFRRDSRISTMAAIIGEEPRPPSEDSTGLPPEVDRAVLRCLRKEPQRRWQSMSDLKSVLEDLKEESESGKLRPAAAVAAPSSRRRLWVLSGLVGILILSAVLFVWIRMRAPARSSDLELVPLTLDAGLSTFASISRDGKIVAYASDRSGEGPLDIWVRHIDRPQPVRTRDPSGALLPSVSPDGSRIVYRSNRRWRVSSPTRSAARNASWSPEDASTVLPRRQMDPLHAQGRRRPG
jgi:serine/threonine protein kinase